MLPNAPVNILNPSSINPCLDKLFAFLNVLNVFNAEPRLNVPPAKSPNTLLSPLATPP